MSGSVTTGPVRKRAGRSALTALGVVLLLAGVGLLGWVGFEYFGTNVLSERAFVQERTQLRATWEAEGTASERGKRPANQTNPANPANPAKPAKPGVPQPGQIPGQAMALLRIPAFGDSYEVPILEGTDLRDLDRGVGHYSSSVMPGAIGNFAIAGHRITHGQPFAKLLELDRGDEVVVETRDAVYTYVIDDPPRDLTVPDTATWVLDPVPGQPGAKATRALITLTTCQDFFRSPDRSVAFGHLVNTRTKG